MHAHSTLNIHKTFIKLQMPGCQGADAVTSHPGECQKLVYAVKCESPQQFLGQDLNALGIRAFSHGIW